MDIRRFYVVSQLGEKGPFSVEELTEELNSGSITERQQVRTGMGTMIGTVRDVLAAPDLTWNPMESTAAGLSAVAVAQRRTRNFSLVIICLTLLPPIILYVLLSPKPVSTSSHELPHGNNTIALPPPMSGTTAVSSSQTRSARTDTPSVSAAIPETSSAHPTTKPMPTSPRSSDVVRLTALTATITVPGARLQGRDTPTPHIGTWNNSEGGVEWKTGLVPGRYAVTLTYACNKSGAGALIVVSADGSTCSEATRDQTSWNDFKPHTFTDPLVIRTAGETTIQVRPGSRKSSAFMKLMEISLRRLP